MPKSFFRYLPKLSISLLVFIAVLLNTAHFLKKDPVNLGSTGGHNLSPIATSGSQKGSTLSPTGTTTKVPTKKPTPIPTTKPANQITLRVTYYGWVDNDPPGKAIAYPQKRYPKSLHQEAGGVGTYNDPVTLAAQKDRWPIGTKFYLPYIQKYGIIEDICANCLRDHLDVWMESNGNYHEELLKCENHWTRMHTDVLVTPTAGLQVNTDHFFNSLTGVCR